MGQNKWCACTWPQVVRDMPSPQVPGGEWAAWMWIIFTVTKEVLDQGGLWEWWMNVLSSRTLFFIDLKSEVLRYPSLREALKSEKVSVFSHVAILWKTCWSQDIWCYQIVINKSPRGTSVLRKLADENSCWNTFASVIRYFAPNVNK